MKITLEQLQQKKRARLLEYLEAHPNLLFGVSAVKNKKGDCLRPQFTRTGASFTVAPVKGHHICEYLSVAWGTNPYDSLGRKIALLAFAAHEATQGFNDNRVSRESMVDFILEHEGRLMDLVRKALLAFLEMEIGDEFIRDTLPVPPEVGSPLVELEVGVC